MRLALGGVLDSLAASLNPVQRDAKDAQFLLIHSRPPLPRWLLALAVGLASSGCLDEPEPRPRHAILILLDAARADRFSLNGYGRNTTPVIDGLASGGVNFPRHYTQGRGTAMALPSILYSRYFARDLQPDVNQVVIGTPDWLFLGRDAESISLPKALEAEGFHTAIISAHHDLRPNGFFTQKFLELHDLSRTLEYEERFGYPSAKQVIDVTLEWLAQHEDDSFFLYVHLMDTHFLHFF